jgi:hypothetical protein
VAEVELSILNLDRMDREIGVYVEGVGQDYMLEQAVRVKNAIVDLIRQRADVNTEGGLADSVYGEPTFVGDERLEASIASDSDHALIFEEGSGIHGPQGAYIFPAFQTNMIFTPRGMTRRVFAQRVQGQPGKHPFRDGLNEIFPGSA